MPSNGHSTFPASPPKCEQQVSAGQSSSSSLLLSGDTVNGSDEVEQSDDLKDFLDLSGDASDGSFRENNALAFEQMEFQFLSEQLGIAITDNEKTPLPPPSLPPPPPPPTFILSPLPSSPSLLPRGAEPRWALWRRRGRRRRDDMGGPDGGRGGRGAAWLSLTGCRCCALPLMLSPADTQGLDETLGARLARHTARRGGHGRQGQLCGWRHTASVQRLMVLPEAHIYRSSTLQRSGLATRLTGFANNVGGAHLRQTTEDS